MRQKILTPGLIILILAFVFVFPRILLAFLDPSNPWTSYLYQYVLGGIAFLIGLWTICKSGSLQLRRGHDSFWFMWLVLGFCIFALGHAIWIWFAVHSPIKV